jgi:hypothetical protein
MSQIINVNGQNFEITNWDEFKEKLLTAVGFQVENEIINQINTMRLVDTGHFKQSITSEVQNGELIITSTAPYAPYLEYGTFDYWSVYGLQGFPKTPEPKKKNISRKAAKKLPKGMQPFAPFRRVLFNKAKMEQIVDKAARLASK